MADYLQVLAQTDPNIYNLVQREHPKILRFQSYCRFSTHDPTPIPPEFWGVPVRVSPSQNLNVITREIIFEVFQPV